MAERIEIYLPTERRFDATLADVYEILEEDLANTLKEYDGDIIDPGAEIDRNMIMLWELNCRLAEAVYNKDHEDLGSVSRVMYRASAFALQVIDDVRDQPIGSLPIAEYMGGDRFSEYNLQADTQDYMSESPLIDALVGKYMPEIDSSGRYNHHAELAAALMFMLAERRVAKDYISSSIDDLQ